MDAERRPDRWTIGLSNAGIPFGGLSMVGADVTVVRQRIGFHSQGTVRTH
jgi:hypothetical protein